MNYLQFNFRTPGNLATVTCCRGGESTPTMCTCDELEEANEEEGIQTLRRKWAECKARILSMTYANYIALTNGTMFISI